MPLYEYKCDKCGDVFEVRQKFSDEPIRVHDKCGGKVERLLSPPAFQFKGSGWYVTDYAGKSGNGSAKNDSAAKDAKETGSTPGKAGESKPAESKPAASEKSKSE